MSKRNIEYKFDKYRYVSTITDYFSRYFLMNEIFLQSETVKVHVTLGPVEDVSESTRQQVDYICCVDLEGNQIWLTNTDQDAIEKMIENKHSQQLGKVSKDIQIFLKLASCEQIRNNKTVGSIEGKMVPNKLAGPQNAGKFVVPSTQEVQFFTRLHDRHDIENQNRRQESAIESTCGSILKRRGIRAELGQF